MLYGGMFFIVFFVTLIQQTWLLNSRPIIGILARESVGGKVESFGESFIPSAYVKFIESGGARVVPIRIFHSERYYRRMFNSINGLLLPGGAANFTASGYFKAAKILLELAMKANAAGDFFPIWGTCRGMQILEFLVAKKDLLSIVDARNYFVPVDFEPDTSESKLFSQARPHILETLRSSPVVIANHKHAVSYEDFHDNEDLSKFFRVLTTNRDRNGRKFVSAFEARDFPFWAVQFHPEKVMFNWDPKITFSPTTAAVEVSQFFTNFFVDQARKSNHRFSDVLEELEEDIHTVSPIYHKSYIPFESIYVFNYSTNVIDLDITV